MLNRTLLMFALLICGAACADTFDVQIGAFRHPNVTDISLPAGVGELRSTSGPNGLTRFVVGPFETRTDAQQALEKLKAAGFGGAFIRATGDRSSAVSARASTPAAGTPPAPAQSVGQQSTSAKLSQEQIEKLLSYSEEERRDLVFLDGRLHKKVGDKFVPLRD